MNIMSFIGNRVDQVNLSDQIKSGRATPVIVKMIDCTNFKIKIEPEWDYQEEYNQIIINNIESYKNLSLELNIMLNIIGFQWLL